MARYRGLYLPRGSRRYVARDVPQAQPWQQRAAAALRAVRERGAETAAAAAGAQPEHCRPDEQVSPLRMLPDLALSCALGF